MKVRVYFDNSDYSVAAKKFLQENNILFEGIDAKTKEGFQKLIKHTQQNRVPAFELVCSHSKSVIVGLDFELLKRELEIKKI